MRVGSILPVFAISTILLASGLGINSSFADPVCAEIEPEELEIVPEPGTGGLPSHEVTLIHTLELTTAQGFFEDINGDGDVDNLEITVIEDGVCFENGEILIFSVFAGPIAIASFVNDEGVNHPPTADAGPDQSVAARDDVCSADVTLDGSGSSDPDGDVLSYEWSGLFGTVSGSVTSVSLDDGWHLITLEVNDGEFTDSDTVEITVEDQTAPVITYITPSSPDVPAGESVWFDVGATDNCSNQGSINVQIVSVTKSTSLVGNDYEITGDLSVQLNEPGWYTIFIEAQDEVGNISQDSVLVVAEPEQCVGVQEAYTHANTDQAREQVERIASKHGCLNS